MRSSRIINYYYRLFAKRSIFAGEICLTIIWAVDHIGLVSLKSIHVWQRYARKTIITFSLLVTLTFNLWSQICSPVIHVQRCVSTKLEVSTSFITRALYTPPSTEQAFHPCSKMIVKIDRSWDIVITCQKMCKSMTNWERLFRARGPATTKARSLIVVRRVAGNTRADEDVDQRRRRYYVR